MGIFGKPNKKIISIENHEIILYENELKEFNLKVDKSFISDSELIKKLLFYSRKLKRNVINSKHINRLAMYHNNNRTVTKFGNDNMKELFRIIDKVILPNYPNLFFDDFFYYDNCKILTYPIDYYDQFYKLGKHSNRILEQEKNKFYKNPDGTATINSVHKAILSHCANIIRDSENILRLERGMKRVGECWITESDLYYKLKKHFNKLKIIHHGSPEWLGRQHVDIWFPMYDIGVEYQGDQHYKPVDFFGGIKSHEENKIRDDRKRKLFKENNATLFEVEKGYDFNLLCKEIELCMNKRFINHINFIYKSIN